MLDTPVSLLFRDRSKDESLADIEGGRMFQQTQACGTLKRNDGKSKNSDHEPKDIAAELKFSEKVPKHGLEYFSPKLVQQMSSARIGAASLIPGSFFYVKKIKSLPH